MKAKFLFMGLFIFVGSVLFAKIFLIPFEEKVQATDFIARVKVISTQPVSESDKGLKLAKLKVIESFKGDADTNTISLEFNDNITCPNVKYSTGEEYILFATKRENGHYWTYNSLFGKALIRSDKSPLEIQGTPFGENGDILLTEAIVKVKNTIRKQKAEKR